MMVNAARFVIFVAIGLNAPCASSAILDTAIPNQTDCCTPQFRQKIEGPKLSDTDAKNGLEGIWTVTEIQGGTIPEGLEIKLEFENGETIWHSTCNIYESIYTLNKNSLSFFPVIPGKNICDHNSNEAEKSLLRAMQRVSNFNVDDLNQLTLLGFGTVLLKAKQ